MDFIKIVVNNTNNEECTSDTHCCLILVTIQNILKKFSIRFILKKTGLMVNVHKRFQKKLAKKLVYFNSDQNS